MSVNKVKDMVHQALSNEKGASVLGTIAEKYINKGIQQGMLQGLYQTIEMGLEIKFGNKIKD